MMMKGKFAPRNAVLVAALAVCSHSAHAFQFETEDSDLKIRWDNTIKYSTIYRLHDPDAAQLTAYANINPQPTPSGSPAGDGDRNFKKGIASNRLDLLSEFDVVKGDSGARISATAWYDSVYGGNNDNTTGLSHNVSTGSNQFNGDTRKAVGNDAKLMDAFVYTKGEIGDMPASVRVGRHTVIYGETLMSGANGIAAAQGAVDIVKAATVPGAQVKEFLLPTNQISATLQPTQKLSFGAYYQFKWEKSYFFPAGSFLSPNDIVGPGSQSFFDKQTLPVPITADMTPKNGGQWGAQMRYKPEVVDVELGFYAANYHDKTPSAVYLNLGTNAFLQSIGVPAVANSMTPTTFTRAYQQNIRTYGASASTVLGSDNVSIEASIRDNQPLTGGMGYVVATGNGHSLADGSVVDNADNPGYAVGKTSHATLVDIHIIQPNFILKDGGSVAIQYDWHGVNSVTKNPAEVDATTTKTASQITVAASADYYQVLEGLDLSIPVVWSHNIAGRSRVYVGWVEKGGSVDTGLNFKYLVNWKGGLNYHHFVGSHGTSIGAGAFNQTQWDRDYVSFNLSRGF
jgi:hypothetical protein